MLLLIMSNTKVFYYDRIDVSETIDVNIASEECDLSKVSKYTSRNEQCIEASL